MDRVPFGLLGLLTGVRDVFKFTPTPIFHGSMMPEYVGFSHGTGSIQGRHRHASQVRAIKKAQRRRAFYRSLRGK